MDNEIKFKVGETYENMKGPFEVVSIRRNEMLIRWGDGSEFATTTDLQQRIIERMAYEKALRQAAEDASKKTRKPKSKPASTKA